MGSRHHPEGHAQGTIRPSCRAGFLGSLDDTPFQLDVAKAKGLLAKAGYPTASR